MPVSLVGGYWVFHSLDRFVTYGVRYENSAGDKLMLGTIGEYEKNRLLQRVRAAMSGISRKKITNLKLIHLFVPKSSLSVLESHMPQSGFDYVNARMLIDGTLTKAEIKYRGDSFWRWAWDKKSMRIKTSRQTLFEGMRSINFLAARSHEQLNNHLSYRLADLMGLVTPRTELVRVFLNGKDRGVYFLVEQPKEIMLRHRNLMPGDFYRGELIPGTKDDFRGGGHSFSI